MSSPRLLPSLVDDIAATDPSRTLYSIATTRNPADGFTDISALIFAQAVDRCAWYIHDALGPGIDFPTLLYIGPQDLMYPVITLASIKTGYKALFSSSRNSLEAHLSLIDKTNCRTFLKPPSFPLPIVSQVLAKTTMTVLNIGPLADWIAGSHKPYPYNKTYEAAKHDPFAVLHTSGSTGLPKPIIQTHATAGAMHAYAHLPGPPATFPNMLTGKRMYTAFPLFHCAGLHLALPCAMYGNFTVVLGPFPPSPDIINSVHVHGNVQVSALAPASWIDLVKVPRYLDNLSRLDLAMFGGGSLQKVTGDLISSETRLLNVLGTTECGPLPMQLCDPEDWSYARFDPILGAEFRHVGGDLYEQVIVRDAQDKEYQGVFGTFPELQEWPMKDIYARHPTQENTWLYKGRTDDIIVLATGEKINPINLESTVSSNPAISGAIVTGMGRTQVSLLIEPTKPAVTEDEKRKLLDRIWPSVEAANADAPSYGRIYRDKVLFTNPEKPMLRAGKGTIQRKMTIDLYQAELDSLYSELLATEMRNGHHCVDNIHDLIRQILVQVIDLPDDALRVDTDFFDVGMDSIQVAAVVKLVNNALASRGAKRMLTARQLYSNPSLATLTDTVDALLDGETAGETVNSAIERMKELYRANVSDMPISGREPLPRSSTGATILLTGSTGSLGSYILDALASDPSVSRIYCLNRGSFTRKRQEQSLASKGLPPLSSKVHCLDANLSESHFGLPSQGYRRLLTEVTEVIHNAWPVDFNMSIDSFARQIDIVRRLVNFSSQSTYGAKIFFISSLSAVAGLAGDVAEETFHTWEAAPENGYGQSKHLAERVLEIAAAEAHVPVAICRVGQVAGPTGQTGMWPKQEWLPSLIASSKYLGRLPASLGRMETVDWVPVDVLARSIREIVLNTAGVDSSSAAVYHTTNPQTSTWRSLVPAVADVLGIEQAGIIPLEKWVGMLRRSAGAEDLVRNPALKLLGFFESLVSRRDQKVVLSTKRTVSVSPSLAGLKPVDDALMTNWMTQWAF